MTRSLSSGRRFAPTRWLVLSMEYGWLMNFPTYAIDQFWSPYRTFAAAATKAFARARPSSCHARTMRGI
jgi:hypothetical protein